MGLSKVNIENTWFTLVGLKLLETYFAESKATWKLVAGKARKALKTSIGFKGEVDQALTILNIDISHI